jgi:hypothetical protein
MVPRSGRIGLQRGSAIWTCSGGILGHVAVASNAERALTVAIQQGRHRNAGRERWTRMSWPHIQRAQRVAMQARPVGGEIWFIGLECVFKRRIWKRLGGER